MGAIEGAIIGAAVVGGLSVVEQGVFKLFRRKNAQWEPPQKWTGIRNGLLVGVVIGSISIWNNLYAGKITLQDAADLANKEVPKKLDEYTTILKVRYEAPRTIAYDYAVQIDGVKVDINAIQTAVLPIVRDKWCNSPDMADIRNLRPIARFNYALSSGEAIGSFSLDTKECP